VVAAFEVGLVVVGGEQFCVGERGVVADQREAAVGRGVVGDAVRVEFPADRLAQPARRTKGIVG
jgi:hypothetical protein